MLNLIKPARLQPGDTVATVSLSWGGAGDEAIRARYETGKARLKEIFGLRVVEMPHTLAGTEVAYEHPEMRAADLMQAFADPSIKAIISCIGGDDTVRLLPYIDFDTIRANPKIFMGYSDTTANHFMCLKAGVSSIYGPAILADFAENGAMPEYTIHWVNKALFSTEPLGEIPPSPDWTSEHLPWSDPANRDRRRVFKPNGGYQLLQGQGAARGPLIGGCIEVLEMFKGTDLFPALDAFDGAIFFLETSEDTPKPENVRWWLRNYGASGILERIHGLVFGKPYGETYFEEYKTEIRKVLKEYGRPDLPVLYNASFGHCEPKFCLPFGALAEIDCQRPGFAIIEPGCR